MLTSVLARGMVSFNTMLRALADDLSFHVTGRVLIDVAATSVHVIMFMCLLRISVGATRLRRAVSSLPALLWCDPSATPQIFSPLADAAPLSLYGCEVHFDLQGIRRAGTLTQRLFAACTTCRAIGALPLPMSQRFRIWGSKALPQALYGVGVVQPSERLLARLTSALARA